MESRIRYSLLVMLVLYFSFIMRAQTVQTRYTIETTFNDTITTTYEGNYGSIKLSSTTADLLFTTNLANLKTGNKKIDSLLIEQERIPFSFQGNLGQGLFGIINEENDDTFHKITGTITVDNISYPAEARIRIENLPDKTNISKALLDLILEFDPKVVKIPFLSTYFNNKLLFQINDGVVNQNN
jgi:hypothetical protein